VPKAFLREHGDWERILRVRILVGELVDWELAQVGGPVLGERFEWGQLGEDEKGDEKKETVLR
jgi:hypothetical protein